MPCLGGPIRDPESFGKLTQDSLKTHKTQGLAQEACHRSSFQFCLVLWCTPQSLLSLQRQEYHSADVI